MAYEKCKIHVEQIQEFGSTNILTEDEDLLAVITGGDERGNGYRLTACWNACDGISDPEQLRTQRDELLEACSELVEVCSYVRDAGDYDDDSHLVISLRQSQDTLAKAKEVQDGS